MTDDVARKFQGRHLESSGRDTTGNIAREHGEESESVGASSSRKEFEYEVRG